MKNNNDNILCLKVTIPNIIYQVICKNKLALGIKIKESPILIVHDNVIKDYNNEYRTLIDNDNNNDGHINMKFINNNNNNNNDIVIYDLPYLIIGNRRIVTNRTYRTCLQNIKIILSGIIIIIRIII